MKVEQVNAYMPEYPVGANLASAKSFGNAMGNKVGVWVFGRAPEKCSVVGQGSSGLILATYMAEAMLKAGARPSIYHVRKQGEVSHDRVLRDDGYRAGNKIVVVDDFIASGETFRNIVENLRLRTTGSTTKPLHIDVLAVATITQPGAFLQDLKLFRVHIDRLLICRNPELAKALAIPQ